MLWSSAIRTRIMRRSSRQPAQRHAQPQARAAARRARDLERAAEEGDALAHALQAERAGLGEVLGRDAAAVVLDLDVQRAVLHREHHPGALRAGMARDVGERLLDRAVHRGGDAPWTALGQRPRRRRRWQATPERLAKSSTSQAAASARPRSSSISGRRSAEMRRVALTVRSSSAPISATRGASSESAGSRSRSQPRSILSAVRSWPSSSCSSRAMCAFSSSRASSTRAESSRSSRCDALQRVLGLLAQRDVAQDHGVVARARPAPACEIEASIGNSSPLSARSAQSVVTSPMRRLVTPVRPKPSMWPRCAPRKRAGRKRSSGVPSTSSRAHAEHLLGGAVEQHDVLRLVDRDDRVHRRVDDRVELRLARLGALLGDAAPRARRPGCPAPITSMSEMITAPSSHGDSRPRTNASTFSPRSATSAADARARPPPGGGRSFV